MNPPVHVSQKLRTKNQKDHSIRHHLRIFSYITRKEQIWTTTIALVQWKLITTGIHSGCRISRPQQGGVSIKHPKTSTLLVQPLEAQESAIRIMRATSRHKTSALNLLYAQPLKLMAFINRSRKWTWLPQVSPICNKCSSRGSKKI